MYHQLARRALGRYGVPAVYLTVYLTILLLPAVFHITAVEALTQVRPGKACINRQGHAACICESSSIRGSILVHIINARRATPSRVMARDASIAEWGVLC